MVPLIPKSVKMEPDVTVRLKATAKLIGYSENQFIAESVKATMDGAEDANNAIPRLFALIRSALNHQQDPQHFGRPVAAGLAARACANAWWGGE